MWHLASRVVQSRTMAKRGVAMGKRGVAAPLGIALVFLASSCSQSTPSATLTPSVVPSPTPTASPPPGGPVPSQLLGNWYFPPSAVEEVSGTPCPANPTPANCFFQLMLAATTYQQSYVATGGVTPAGQGDVVVNNDEIDFFSGVLCGLKLPNGVGRYTWRITAGVLYLTLISDPCSRKSVYTDRGWNRTP
jgi:hypothetical protein